MVKALKKFNLKQNKNKRSISNKKGEKNLARFSYFVKHYPTLIKVTINGIASTLKLELVW
ncbi:hypothetical protein HpMS53_02400 [Helicobacter pylori]